MGATSEVILRVVNVAVGILACIGGFFHVTSGYFPSVIVGLYIMYGPLRRTAPTDVQSVWTQHCHTGILRHQLPHPALRLLIQLYGPRAVLPLVPHPAK